MHSYVVVKLINNQFSIIYFIKKYSRQASRDQMINHHFG